MFIDAGLPVNAPQGTMPFHLTVGGPNGGHAEAAALLLDAKQEDTRTPPHLAAIHNAHRVAEVLIAHGCDLDPISYHRDERITPLMKAIDHCNHVIVEKLIAAGARLDTTDHRRKTPLFAAVLTGEPLVVHLLLLAGCDVNLATRNGTTPFRASLYKSPFISEMLVLTECRVTHGFPCNETGISPLPKYPSLSEWLI